MRYAVALMIAVAIVAAIPATVQVTALPDHESTVAPSASADATAATAVPSIPVEAVAIVPSSTYVDATTTPVASVLLIHEDSPSASSPSRIDGRAEIPCSDGVMPSCVPMPTVECIVRLYGGGALIRPNRCDLADDGCNAPA